MMQSAPAKSESTNSRTRRRRRRRAKAAAMPVASAGGKRKQGRRSPARAPRTPPQAHTDPDRLASEILRREYFADGVFTLRFWRGEWWKWDEHRYSRIAQQTLISELWKAIRSELNRVAAVDRGGHAAKVSTSLVRNVVHAIASEVQVDDNLDQPIWLGRTDPPREAVAMENGLLNLGVLLKTAGSSGLRPLTPEWFSSVSVPYSYDMKARCPRWTRFLEEIFAKDQQRIDLVQEFFGYCLTHDTRYEKFVIAFGEGANGKSVLLSVLESLVGPDNVSHVPLEDFGQRFQLSWTLGKLVNICSEIGSRVEPRAIDVLKGYITGDRMTFDRKYLPALHVRPTARLIFATNNAPSFSDRSEGVWRRLIPLPCDVVIPKAERDIDLPNRLKEELPGIFNWSVVGLARLRSQGGFTEPVACVAALSAYRAASNPTEVFLREACREHSTGSVRTEELYRAYTTWCSEGGHQPLDASQFGKEVRRVYPKANRGKLMIEGKRVPVYQGLVLDIPSGGGGEVQA